MLFLYGVIPKARAFTSGPRDLTAYELGNDNERRKGSWRRTNDQRRRTDLPVPIAFLTLELTIEAAQSLKDRRQVVRSVKDRLRAHFNVAVAELDPSNLWNRATIGVVSISDSRDYLDGLMKNVERHATRVANNAGAEISDSFVEFL